jgi:hypothetical protein
MSTTKDSVVVSSYGSNADKRSWDLQLFESLTRHVLEPSLTLRRGERRQ